MACLVKVATGREDTLSWKLSLFQITIYTVRSTSVVSVGRKMTDGWSPAISLSFGQNILDRYTTIHFPLTQNEPRSQDLTMFVK